MIRSLRAQLALWHGVLLAVTLMALAGFTYFLMGQVLTSRADTDLLIYADKTSRDIASKLYRIEIENPNGISTDKLKDREKSFIDETSSWGRFVQVDDRDGKYIVSSDALKTQHFNDNPETRQRILSAQNRSVFDDLPVAYPMRVATVPVQMGNRIPYLVRVGVPVEGVTEAVGKVSLLLIFLTPSIFIVALLGGWFLVGRSLKPVDEMTRAALSIESKRLDIRLVPKRPDDEIGRLASALNEMIARLDRSFKQIERFSADASHELKTPLTTIRGEAEVALMSPGISDELKHSFRSIIEETERLSEIVTNLLLLARTDADQVRLKQEPVALHEIAMQAYEPMERLARRKSILLDIAEMEEVQIRGDALWVQQLITNLLHNAINYTPEGGKVTLSLKLAPSRESYSKSQLSTSKQTALGDFALLSVSDTGPGIPAEHLNHIFDRFYRVDSGRSRDQGGSGLGLNIVKWIAESHGGVIVVESEVGTGTVFSVKFPVMQD